MNWGGSRATSFYGVLTVLVLPPQVARLHLRIWVSTPIARNKGLFFVFVLVYLPRRLIKILALSRVAPQDRNFGEGAYFYPF